eukprot:gene11906-biopygen5349
MEAAAAAVEHVVDSGRGGGIMSIGDPMHAWRAERMRTLVRMPSISEMGTRRCTLHYEQRRREWGTTAKTPPEGHRERKTSGNNAEKKDTGEGHRENKTS